MIRGCERCSSVFVGHKDRRYCSRSCANKSRIRITAERRFIRKIVVTDSCWVWRGFLAKGYGSFTPTRTKLVPAHRFSYETFVGRIPGGYEIDHLCRNRACVRPDHLEAVTQYENNLRSTSPIALNARKTMCPKGHPYDVARADGARGCLRCRAEATRRYYARLKETA